MHLITAKDLLTTRTARYNKHRKIDRHRMHAKSRNMQLKVAVRYLLKTLYKSKQAKKCKQNN